MKRFLQQHSLSLVLFGLFSLTLIGLALAGHSYYNNEQQSHGAAPVPFAQFLASGTFIEAVFENWESEFLQMGALVLLTMWFRQKGSKDSKKLRGGNDVDVPPKHHLIKTPWPKKIDAIKEAVYANSLSLALFGLFFISFILHAISGASAHNQEALEHHQKALSTLAYITTSQFWFESFQNWQSEFLSVGVLILFTIFLRQRYSPESKPIGKPNTTTGD